VDVLLHFAGVDSKNPADYRNYRHADLCLFTFGHRKLHHVACFHPCRSFTGSPVTNDCILNFFAFPVSSMSVALAVQPVPSSPVVSMAALDSAETERNDQPPSDLTVGPVAADDEDDDDDDDDDDDLEDDGFGDDAGTDDVDDGFNDGLDEDDDLDDFDDIDEDDFDDEFDDDFEEELSDDYEIQIDDEISDEFGLSTGKEDEEDDVDLEDFEDFENV
jgi:hypothetical protein